MSEQRFNVIITGTDETGEPVEFHTHTFAENYQDAVIRMQRGFGDRPDVWSGWDFQVMP